MKWPLLSITVKARFTSFTVLEIVAAGAINSDPETLATEGTWAEAAMLRQTNKERTTTEKRTNPSRACILLPRNAASTGQLCRSRTYDAAGETAAAQELQRGIFLARSA